MALYRMIAIIYRQTTIYNVFIHEKTEKKKTKKKKKIPIVTDNRKKITNDYASKAFEQVMTFKAFNLLRF